VKNLVQPVRLQTHSEYVVRIAFSTATLLHEHASMLRYTYTACPALPLQKEIPILYRAASRLTSWNDTAHSSGKTCGLYRFQIQ